jgi:hypothetical protein
MYGAREVLRPEKEVCVPGKVSSRRRIAHPPPSLVVPGGSRAHHLDAPTGRVIWRGEARCGVDGKRGWGRSMWKKGRGQGRVVDAGGIERRCVRRRRTATMRRKRRKGDNLWRPTAQDDDDLWRLAAQDGDDGEEAKDSHDEEPIERRGRG